MAPSDADPRDQPGIRQVAADRLVFFVDAVIAIAMTLLALSLPLPQGSTNTEVLRSALDLRDEYIAFAISFVVIAAYWRAHHRLFLYVVRLSTRLTTITLCWLLTLVITPFAMKLLNGEGAFQVRFVFYAIVQVAACVLFILLVWEVRHAGLCRDTMPPGFFSHIIGRIGFLTAGFLVSIGVSFVTEYAYACWIALPAIGVLLDRRRGDA
ncbi:MAG TPA: TMEM175 family protein [Amycolatopsis sp.]|nr:TMEM175 family protein [Amycolatopsis sp.]